MVRTKILSRLWTDRCDVYTHEGKLYHEVPCRVSFRRGIEAMGMIRNVHEAAMEAVQAVRLFLAPDVDIPAGSRIVVRCKDGRELRFHRSGVPVEFEGHQEIRMEREERFV